ncbi:MAG TPA: hypothetical protein H9759_12815 [Candidatus Dietzia intestinipullorum]|nr:hypothetical protein [Candidatus Dietzia intestinipullorum]
MTGLLGFWDRMELWLVTLPFALQVFIMMVMGIPLFVLVAVGTDRFAELLVRGFRRLVAPRSAGTGKEVR